MPDICIDGDRLISPNLQFEICGLIWLQIATSAHGINEKQPFGLISIGTVENFFLPPFISTATSKGMEIGIFDRNSLEFPTVRPITGKVSCNIGIPPTCTLAAK